MHFLKERGIDARRGQQFAGGTDSPDVIANGVLRGYHLEVKNTQRTDIYGWLDQACTDADLCKVPVVAHKKNKERWVAIIDMRDFVSMVQQLDAASSNVRHFSHRKDGEDMVSVLKSVMP